MNSREKLVAKRLEARKIAVKQYNAEILHDMEDGKPFYQVETKGIYSFSSLKYHWNSSEDAIRYCKEQVKAGTEARVVKHWYVKEENTLYTEKIYTK